MAQTPFNSRREDLVMLSTDKIRGEDSTTGSGDALALRGGNSTGGGGFGADVTIDGGTPHTGGKGGDVLISGTAGNTAGDGGSVFVNAAASPSGNQGDVVILASGSSALVTPIGATIQAVAGTTATVNGANLILRQGGAGSFFGSGGYGASLIGGSAIGASGAAGDDVQITAGAGDLAGDGGWSVVQGGNSGASGTAGSVYIAAGSNATTLDADDQGSVFVLAGNATPPASKPGVFLFAGNDAVFGTGSKLSIGGPDATGTSAGSMLLEGGDGLGVNAGGTIALTAGAAPGVGDGGSITVATGTSVSGTAGLLSLQSAGDVVFATDAISGQAVTVGNLTNGQLYVQSPLVTFMADGVYVTIGDTGAASPILDLHGTNVTLTNSFGGGAGTFTISTTNTGAAFDAGDIAIVAGNATNAGVFDGGTISLLPGTSVGGLPGSLIFNYATFPAVDAAGALTSDGAGNLSWGAGAAAALSAVLVVGNTTGGEPIVVSSTDDIRGEDLAVGTTLALRGGNSTTAGNGGADVTVSGGTNTNGAPGNTDGGDVVLNAGAGTGTGDTGNLIVNADGTFFQSDVGAFVVIGKTPYANTVSLDLASTATGTLENAQPGGVLELRTFTTAAPATNTGDLTISTGTNANAVSGDTGDLILSSGPVTNAGSSGNPGSVLLNPGAAAGSGTDGTVRISGANQSLHGGTAGRRFQILGGTLAASGIVDSDGPSVFLKAQGSATQNGAEVNIGHALLGSGSFTGRGGNAISGNAIGGNSALLAGNGFGTGNGGDITAAAGQGGASGTGDGGDAFVSGGTAGAGNGGGGGVTLTAKAGNGTGTPGDISFTTSGGLVKTRTTSGFGGSEKEDQTFGSQTVTGVGNSVLMVVVGTLAADGQNLKITVDASGVNNIDDTDVVSGHIVQTFYRASATVSAMTAHVDDQQFVGTWPSTTTPSFSLVINGDDIELHFAWTGVLVGSITVNTAAHWTRQEGGFTL